MMMMMIMKATSFVRAKTLELC